MATRSRAMIAGMLAGPAALAVAGVLVNGLNLFMNLVLARVLDPARYGAVVVQVSIFMILSVVGNALLIAVVQRETADDGDSRRAQRAWIRRLRGVCGIGVVAASAAAVLLCRPAAALLSYAHPLAVAEAVIGAAVWTLLCVERGVLQARGAYPRLAVNFVVEAALRIGLIVAFVGAGLGVNGAGLGLVLGIALGAEHARLGVAKVPRPARAAKPPAAAPPSTGAPDSRVTFTGPVRSGGAPALGEQAPGPDGAPDTAVSGPRPLTATGPLLIPGPTRSGRSGLLADTWVALGALVPLALLQNMDVVIVGWLDHDGAGAYAAISTACKIPVFIGLAVANFLLPEAARRRAAGHGTAPVLAVALAFVVTPGLLLAALGSVAARPLLSMVFGPDLAGAASSLSVLALGMTCLAVTLMFTTYLLGAAQRQVVAVLTVCAVVTAAALGLAGGDPMRTSLAGLACHAMTALVLGALVHRLHRADARAATAPAAATGEAGTVPPGQHPPGGEAQPVGVW
ncbi:MULTISPECIES: lipopolysaccharide biosynthesis protein [unclassified Parafrankia]|uniref:lipopolysaccharide biosynthesis protein n=1 Tax=unclassified Parafrankia TaxID=2994368 RepID=UPI000DA46E96|nr:MULTISPECIES: polysaccharide biosynthesis protein [unclassified Parafrankia]TCJ40467.1 polysaccharide biosynthesis protein [Parafrankia sp. BMG5.11]SQD95466.1 Polysaccharide biosynthesis protein [Parafrankia sp. Ea1.12]